MSVLTLRRVLSACAVGAAALVLSACQAGPVTSISVSSDGSATSVVKAVFTGEAAQSVEGSLDQFTSVFQSYVGAEPQVDVSDDAIVVQADVPLEQLGNSSSVTGVRAVDVSTGEQVSVQVDLVAPTSLEGAIRDSVSNDDDSEAVLPLLLEATSVSVQVTFPGAVTGSSDPGAVVDGNQVTLRRPLSATDAMWVVTGERSSGVDVFFLTGIGVVAVGAAGLAFQAVRKHGS